MYQVYRSLEAWLSLSNSQSLLLEVAEDFAVLANQSLKATQVKNTAPSKSVTLRTKAIKTAIDSFWQFQAANPDKEVRLVFLTTSTIGKEQGFEFPGGEPGLSYWRVAARHGAEVRILSSFLASLEFSEDLKQFLRTATDSEVQGRLLRRIQWECGAAELDQVDRQVRERLVYIGEANQSFEPSDASRVRDALLAHLFRKIVGDVNRELTRADLMKVVAEATSISIPFAQLRKHGMFPVEKLGSGFDTSFATPAPLLIDTAAIPGPSPAAERKELIAGLTAKLRSKGVLWLHGSSGKGKTYTSLRVAALSGGSWYLLGLRGCDAGMLYTRFYSVFLSIEKLAGFAGIILDDFPVEHATESRVQLSMLAAECLQYGANIIVTSQRGFPPSLHACFSGYGVSECVVPSLSLEDVGEMITATGSDSGLWAKVVHTTAGFGHPQLVTARISGLSQRGWPENERIDGLVPAISPASDVESELASVRLQLIHELTDEARELLYRVAVIGSQFDRELALAISEIGPPIPRPGDVLDLLTGPWLEVRAGARLFVSPLVSQTASQLSQLKRNQVSRKIVESLLQRRPFPGDFLSTLLIHALTCRHEAALLWLAGAVLHNFENRRVLADELFFLPLIGAKSQQPLFPNSPFVSVMLRMAQLEIALANETRHHDELPYIVDRLLKESEAVPGPAKTKPVTRLIVLGKILMQRAYHLNPRLWIPLLIELDQLIESSQTIDILSDNFWAEEVTVGEALFLNRLTTMTDIADLEGLFDALADIEAHTRTRFLRSCRKLTGDYQLIVGSAWYEESKQKTLDGVKAAERYSRLARVAESWSDHDLAVECECATVVMLDEYADDSKSALEAVGLAESKYPGNYRLSRVRARVFYRRSEYRLALEAIEEVESDLLLELNPVDRAHVFREAGISAAQIGELQKAARFLSHAFESAVNCGDGMKPFAAGTLGDCALASFMQRHYKNCRDYAIRAFETFDEISSAETLNYRYCSVVLGHMVLWMRSQIDKSRWKDLQSAMWIGMCSNPEPHEEFMKRPVPLSLVKWYQLAELEVDLNLGKVALDALRSRTKHQELPECKMLLDLHRLVRAAFIADTVQFINILPAYAFNAVRTNQAARSGPSERLTVTETVRLPDESNPIWQDEFTLGVMRASVSLFVAVGLSFGRWHVIKDLASVLTVTNTPITRSLTLLVQEFETPLAVAYNESHRLIPACLGVLTKAGDDSLDPEILFAISCHLCSWLMKYDFHAEIGTRVEELLAAKWKEVIRERQFQLRQPAANVPKIEKALASRRSRGAKLAEICLAAEPSVSGKASTELRKFFQSLL